MPANANDVADFLESHGFDRGPMTVGCHRKAPDQVTFHLNGLTGVHIPWLSERIGEMGWHIEKVENPGGGAIVTVEQGTDPFIPTGPDPDRVPHAHPDALRAIREWFNEPLDLGFPDHPHNSFATAAEERQ